MSTVATSSSQQVSWGRTLAAGGIAAVVAILVNTVIAAVAHGPLDAPSTFTPLQPPVYGMWTIIGTVIGAIGWRIVTRRSADPSRLLRILVPAVLIVSFVPDLGLLAAPDALPGSTTAGVLSLMVMHVAVAAIAVSVYRRFMPPAA